MNYLSAKDLAARFGITLSTVWRWNNDKTLNFPKPVKLSPGCTRWKLSEIEAWEAQRSQPAKAGRHKGDAE